MATRRRTAAKASEPSDEGSIKNNGREDEQRRKLWMAAIKPPMYSVGFIPVLVGGAAVYSELGVMPWARCLGFVLASILVIAWLNLSNDAFDATTGVDKHKAESVVNLTGNRGMVLALANALLVCGVSLLGYLFTATGDARVAVMLGVALACGYVYQGPPFRLSYKGLGEPLCFLAFGLMATPAFYLAMQPTRAVLTATAAAQGLPWSLLATTPAISPLVWTLGLLVGLTTTVILFCSHFHQRDGDIAAGKNSPIVRLGVENALLVLHVATGATHVMAITAALVGTLPIPALVATLLAVPAALNMLRFARDNRKVPAKVAPLKRYAVAWHIAFGLSLVIGLVGGRLVA